MENWVNFNCVKTHKNKKLLVQKILFKRILSPKIGGKKELFLKKIRGKQILVPKSLGQKKNLAIKKFG